MLDTMRAVAVEAKAGQIDFFDEGDGDVGPLEGCQGVQ